MIAPYTSATQRPQTQMPPPHLIVAESGRQIRLPSLSLVYLGWRDEKENIYPHVDLTPDDGAAYGVSRRHARIHQSDNGFFIEDLDTANGTFINGQRLSPSQMYPIYHGDRLCLGQLQLKVAWLPEIEF